MILSQTFAVFLVCLTIRTKVCQRACNACTCSNPYAENLRKPIPFFTFFFVSTKVLHSDRVEEAIAATAEKSGESHAKLKRKAEVSKNENRTIFSFLSLSLSRSLCFLLGNDSRNGGQYVVENCARNVVAPFKVL